MPADSPVPVQQADAQLDGTVRYGSPLKKVAGLMRAGLLPPGAFFFFKYFH